MRTGLALLAVVLGGGSAAYADTSTGDDGTITVVLVGDVGLNRGRLEVRPGGVAEGKGTLPWEAMTVGIRDLIDGDLNFLNLETVVTARNDLDADSKGQKAPFNFRTHPAAVRHLVEIGFNLMSLANNHMVDDGEQGVRDTITHVEALESKGLRGFAGAGLDRDAAAAPVLIETAGASVAFSALGIVTNNMKRHRAGAEKPGSMAYRIDEDWQLVTDRLARTKADYRILSIHYGYERKVRVDDRQLREWRHAVKQRGVDLIAGHHAHVARGVEINGDSVIFYGLGNFLHRGTKNMGGVKRFRLCRDFGLLARVHLRPGSDGRLRARAIEAVPVYGMHRRPAPFSNPEQGKRRIEVLNYHARALDSRKSGAVGVRFTPRKDGSGIYCFPGAEAEGGKLAKLCRGVRAPEPPGADLRKEIEAACHARNADGSKPKKKRAKRKKRKKRRR